MSKIKVAIAGCSGRMGRILLESVLQAENLQLHAALEHTTSTPTTSGLNEINRCSLIGAGYSRCFFGEREIC